MADTPNDDVSPLELLFAKQRGAEKEFDKAFDAVIAKLKEGSGLELSDPDYESYVDDLTAVYDGLRAAHSAKDAADRACRERLAGQLYLSVLLRRADLRARRLESKRDQKAGARQMLAAYPTRLLLPLREELSFTSIFQWCVEQAGTNWDYVRSGKHPYFFMYGFKDRKVAMHFKLAFGGVLQKQRAVVRKA